MKSVATTIDAYNQLQTDSDRAVCDILRAEIDKQLPEAESKIWHGSPVWFLDGNPIVGYSKLKAGVQLLFWSGRSFDESSLKPEGSFKAASIFYTNSSQIDFVELKRWLTQARTIQWDYQHIVKNRGLLVRKKS